MKARIIVGIFALLLGVLMAIQAVAVRHWFDGTGVSYLIVSILLLIVGSVLCGTELGVFFIYALLVTFLAIGYHVEPHVTSSEPLCTHEDNRADAPQLLQDTTVFCSPLEGCPHWFACISHDTEIHRSDRCIHCGRPFSQHFVVLYAIQRWVSMVATDRRLAEQDYI